MQLKVGGAALDSLGSDRADVGAREHRTGDGAVDDAHPVARDLAEQPSCPCARAAGLVGGYAYLVRSYGPALVLLGCLYLCARSNIQTEVIKFSPDTVTIEQGRTFAERSWEYNRSWAKIFVRKPRLKNSPDQVVIRSHGKELELGSFLNSDDKERLVKKLRKIIYQ